MHYEFNLVSDPDSFLDGLTVCGIGLNAAIVPAAIQGASPSRTLGSCGGEVRGERADDDACQDDELTDHSDIMRQAQREQIPPRVLVTCERSRL